MNLNISAVPFILGFLLIITQPVLDIVWMEQFDKRYNAEDAALVGAAKWIADVSAFLPTAFLSIFGALLIVITSTSENLVPWLILAAFVAILAALVAYILTVYKSAERKNYGLYSTLQYSLMLLNVLGVVAAMFVA